MTSRNKKKKYSFDLTKDLVLILFRMIYFTFFFSWSFIQFIVREIFQTIKPHQGQIIYTARHFRKKHKPKVFQVDITFLKKIKFGTKIKILFGIIVLFFIAGTFVWYFIFRTLPSPIELTNRKIDVSTKIYDRNGILLYQIYRDQNRTPVLISAIPQTVKYATLAGEDAAFYREHGFSLKGIVRALLTDLTNRDFGAGGSTITQQLVKNTLLTNEKTIIRKIKELILAIQVENTFSKDKILEMYLNEVSYGGSAYGIQAAAQTYFGKDVSQLDLAESALLAGLPKSPTTYSPFGENPELATQRQKEILRLMEQNHFITAEAENEAINEKLNFANGETQIKAPHFVMYIRQKLVDQYGEEEVESGGLSVITTLDYNIQQIAQEVVKSQVEKLKGLHVGNGAAIVLDPSTGEILAMVGSTDYFNSANDGNVNVTTALRPPGSSIKVVNYAYALSHGYTPGTIILDAPISFKFPGYPTYTPVNYDGKFVGNITLRNALAESRNIPAVKVLASYGVPQMISMGQAMGITTWNEQNTYGLSLTLGGGSTKLIDMARVFATIADYGNRPPIISIKRVTDYRGNNLPVDCDTDCEKNQVLDPRVSYQLIDILKDNNARAPEFGLNSSLVISGHPEVAVKTGTSNDLRDNLTIGFNQKYLTAVWVGNNDNSPMSRIASGITGAAPIWNEIMTKLFSLSPSSNQWIVPDGLKQAPCRGLNEYFLSETDTANICNIKEGTPSGQIVDDKNHKHE